MKYKLYYKHFPHLTQLNKFNFSWKPDKSSIHEWIPWDLSLYESKTNSASFRLLFLDSVQKRIPGEQYLEAEVFLQTDRMSADASDQPGRAVTADTEGSRRLRAVMLKGSCHSPSDTCRRPCSTWHHSADGPVPQVEAAKHSPLIIA